MSVNLAVGGVSQTGSARATGIDKRPVAGPVLVRSPGTRAGGLGGGLVGDQVCNRRYHGGDDQAVYAYAREDYDFWQAELGRELPGGFFGDNLTTGGIDVNAAVIGEQWRIGATLLLQTTFARIPCGTFRARMGERGWTKRFTEQARPGAYLRVVEPGEVSAGDEVRIEGRPGHGVTIVEGFKAWTREPQLIPRLVEVEQLPEDVRKVLRRRLLR